MPTIYIVSNDDRMVIWTWTDGNFNLGICRRKFLEVIFEKVAKNLIYLAQINIGELIVPLHAS